MTTLADRAYRAGRHEILWDGRGRDGAPVPSGTYLSRLQALGEEATVRITLVR